VAALTGALWPALAVLVVPGAGAMVLLLWVRSRTEPRASAVPTSRGSVPAPPVPAPATGAPLPAQDAPAAAAGAPVPAQPDPAPVGASSVPVSRQRLPRTFWLFAASAGAATAGLVTFGVISFHLTQDRVVPVALVPVVYAGAMAVGAVAALVTGWLYDRLAGRVLLVLPLLVTAVPLLAFADHPLPAVAGVLVWGAAVGVQDSSVKALVADLVPAPRRATAYGSFAAVQGGAAVLGGAAAGWLSSRSVPALVALVAATQLVALALLLATLRGSARPLR
jgi:predicted MFS family arabinose efflux permease